VRFPDGAFRPGYNARIAVAPTEGISVSGDMTTRCNDAGLATLLVGDIVRRYGAAPQTLLVDTKQAMSSSCSEQSAANDACGGPTRPQTIIAQ
jgi:hypothetical protein